jgi:hypothetical protein
MHTYLILNFRPMGKGNVRFIKGLVLALCLVIALVGLLLVHPGSARAVEVNITPVGSPVVTTTPSTITANGANQWEIHFNTANGFISSGDIISVEFPGDFTYNINFATNTIASGANSNTTAIYVNGIAPSSVEKNESVLQIHVGSISPSSQITVTFMGNSVLNPAVIGLPAVRFWTSIDTKPLLAEPSTLSVTLSNSVQGAKNVKYLFSFNARQLIDYDNPIALRVPWDLVYGMIAAPTSQVLLNTASIERIWSGDGFVFVKPALGQSISVGAIVTLEFTEGAGLKNPVIVEGDPTQEFIISDSDNGVNKANVTYRVDEVDPTGSFTINGDTARTYSRYVTLHLSAQDDAGGSGIDTYQASTNRSDLEGYGDGLEDYQSQAQFLLPGLSETNNTGSETKTVYVKFYDGYGNESPIYPKSIEYSTDLDLTSLSLNGGYSASAGGSEDNSNYNVVVSSTINSLNISPNKQNSNSKISVSDSRASYSQENNLITFSDLAAGANDLVITVTSMDGTVHKDYHLLVYKEGISSLAGGSNGQIVRLGGLDWILADKDKRMLLLKSFDKNCPYSDYYSEYSGQCTWVKNQSYWDSDSNEAGYIFNPNRADSVAYYLNHEFWNSLGLDQSLVSIFPFDDTLYTLESTFDGNQPLSEKTKSNLENHVSAKVGLLSVEQYEQLTGVNSQFMDSPWFLMNPLLQREYESSEGEYSMMGVEVDGTLTYESDAYSLRPVLYLNSNVVIKGGTGEPFTLEVQLTDQQAVDAAASNLALTADPDLNHVTGNISLPLTANNGTTISWASSDPSVIAISSGTGVVTRPNYGSGNATVNLIATIIKGSVSLQKTIPITVLEVEHVPSSNADLSSLFVEGSKLTLIPNTTAYTQSVTNNTYSTFITAKFDTGASMTINGFSLASDVAKTVNLSIGNNTFLIKVTAENGTQKTYTLTILYSATSDGQTGGQTITQQLQAALDALQQSAFLNDNLSSSQITQDLTLPTTTGGTNGYTIGWTSTPSIISSSGVVTRPLYTETDPSVDVKLTATVTSATYSKSREFPFTVLRGLMPQQDFTVSPTQTTVTFDGGITMDFTGSSFGPGAKVTVKEIVPPNISGTGMIAAGKTLEFTTEGVTIDPAKPVKVTIPANSGANLGKIGIFFYNPTTQAWEYQKTEVGSNGAAFTYLTHFSTYGVFEANKVVAPSLDASYFTNDVTKEITLSTTTAGAAIYYTLDGSTPTAASSPYAIGNKPKLQSTQTFKVIAVKNGMVTSDTVSIIGKERRTILSVLTDIKNRVDQNGDSKFDQTDVGTLLGQLEPLHGK